MNSLLNRTGNLLIAAPQLKYTVGTVGNGFSPQGVVHLNWRELLSGEARESATQFSLLLTAAADKNGGEAGW